jgi:hypothetical protein
MLIENFIKFVLSERSKYEEKTNETFNDSLRNKLLSLATKDHPVKYAFTMTDVERVGIYIKTSYNTPAGVYFYPLTENYCKKLIENTLPFASNRKFVGIVKLRNFDNQGKWLKFINKGESSVSDDAVKKAIELMNSKASRKINFENEALHFSFNNDAKVFDAGYLFSQNNAEDKIKSTTSWASFLRKLGYIGIYDSGNAVVHSGEPTQIVCLVPEAYEIVDIFEIQEIRKKRNIKHDKKSEIESWLSELSGDKREKVAESPKTSAKVLATMAIVYQDYPSLMSKIVANKNTHPSVLKHLVRSKDIYLIRKMFKNENMTNEVLDEMGEYTINNCIKELSIDPGMSLKTITLLIHRDEGRNNKAMRDNVAKRTDDQDLLLRLSKDESDFVRTSVARNSHAPLEALNILAHDKDKIVRQNVGKAKNASPEILSFLSKDESDDVRYFVASNVKTPKDALAALAKDDFDDVVKAVIWNDSTDASVLRELSNDPSPNLSHQAKHSLSFRENPGF